MARVQQNKPKGTNQATTARGYDFVHKFFSKVLPKGVDIGGRFAAWCIAMTSVFFNDVTSRIVQGTAQKVSNNAKSSIVPPKPKSGRPSPPNSGSKRAAKSQKTQDNMQEPAFVYEDYAKREGGTPETQTEKRIRALRKKLREIEMAEERVNTGQAALDSALTAKIASKSELEQQIEELKAQAAMEAREVAEQKAIDDERAAAAAAAEKARAEQRAVDKAIAEAALAKARRDALEVIPNISPAAEATKGDPRLTELLRQISDLSMDVFSEDCVKQGISKRTGWRLSILARPVPEDPSIMDGPAEAPTELLGFMVFRFRPDWQCLSVAKIAVPQAHRGRGFGRHLMEWVTRYAQQQGNLQYISLSSLPEAVKFYQAFGFKAVKIESIPDSEDYVEGQVYMEYRLKGSSRRLSR